MLCPACGQFNTSGSSSCLLCGYNLYQGGAQVDTARTSEGGAQMVVMEMGGEGKETLPPVERIDDPPAAATPAKEPSEKAAGESAGTDGKSTAAALAKKTAEKTAGASVGAGRKTRRRTHRIYAGFWHRFLALCLDGVVIAMALAGLGALMTVVGMVHLAAGDLSGFAAIHIALAGLGLVAALLYFALCESSKWQATLGKLAVGLKVTDVDGERISFLRAIGRRLAHFFSNITLGFGYLLNLFTPRQQALHDLIAGTLVLYKKATEDDLDAHPRVPAPASQRVAALAVWAMCVLLAVTLAIVGRSLIGFPSWGGFTDDSLDSRVYEAEMFGARASAAATDYFENHQRFPPTLGVAGFEETSREISRIWIDAESGEISLEFDFSPLRKKILRLTPEVDGEGDVVWFCHSNDIDARYLPEHCR